MSGLIMSAFNFMHNLLSKWLEKRGIKSPDELDNTPMPDGSPTELQTFEEYRRVLSKEKIEIGDIKEFCLNKIGQIEAKWANLDILADKKNELIPYYTVYKQIITAIDGSVAMREALEKHLEQLLK